MDTATMSRFFAILSLACWLGTISTVVLAIVYRANPASALGGLFDSIRESSLWFGWVIAAVTTAGSLYYSEIAHFEPCKLCWLQRICMYPLSIILLIAAIRRDRGIWRYTLPLVLIGMTIATYHTQLQAWPRGEGFCSTLVPCTTRTVWEFGFVSLPFMDLAALVFILVMLLLARSAESVESDEDELPETQRSEARA
jgi:disulfide bond formation protein DsbB